MSGGIDLGKLTDEDRADIRRIMSGEADEDRIRRGDVHEAIRSLRTNPVPSREYQRALGDVAKLVSRLTIPAQGLDAATIERCGWALVDAWCREQSLPPIDFAPDELNALVTATIRALNTASTTTRGEDARLREALEEAVSVLEALPYGDWPGAKYHGKVAAANALIRQARAALQGDAAHTSQEKGNG